MNRFTYAEPQNLSQLQGLLESVGEEAGKEVAFLSGGTDLIGLMQKNLVAPDTVINLCEIPELCQVRTGNEFVEVGAAVRLSDLARYPAIAECQAVGDALRQMDSIQYLAQSTVGGELCRRPRCWYFRAGHGLLADNGRRVTEGDNRYHAILGNDGPAKFVSPSRLAAPLIALGAQVRLVGPSGSGGLGDGPRELPLRELYHAPGHDGQREHALEPGELVSHLLIPLTDHLTSATYEVHHGAGSEPLVSAAVALELVDAIVRDARIVLGHVAPIPWVATAAAETLVGQAVTPEAARHAGQLALAQATPLSDNAYKVQQAQVAVSRAIMQAARVTAGGSFA